MSKLNILFHPLKTIASIKSIIRIQINIFMKYYQFKNLKSRKEKKNENISQKKKSQILNIGQNFKTIPVRESLKIFSEEKCEKIMEGNIFLDMIKGDEINISYLYNFKEIMANYIFSL